jgi:hypothetical protein
MAGAMPDRSFIYHADRGKYAWPGGHGIEAAVVSVNLGDLAAYFFVPIMLDGNTLAVVLAVPTVGPMTVVAQNIEINHYNQRELTPEEIERMAFTFQDLNLFIGREADLEAAKAFVRDKFPCWAQVHFYDELRQGVPAKTVYEGPTADHSWQP